MHCIRALGGMFAVAFPKAVSFEGSLRVELRSFWMNVRPDRAVWSRSGHSRHPTSQLDRGKAVGVRQMADHYISAKGKRLRNLWRSIFPQACMVCCCLLQEALRPSGSMFGSRCSLSARLIGERKGCQ